MKMAISRFVMAAAIVAAMVLAGSTAALAACPTSPNFTPDFTNNQSCLTLNDSAAFGPTAFSLTQPVGTTNPAQPAPSGVTTVVRLTPNSNFKTGSAWFNTQQPVAGTFSTTFTFQLSGETSGVGDGIAFVIQNSPQQTNALDADNGTDGCSLGFGDAPTGTCTANTGGITNSVAVEFDTFQNTDIGDPNANHVAIQSCATLANSVDSTTCFIAGNSSLPVTLADGGVHTVTITFTPPTSGSGPGILHVSLDNNELFPSGVAFDMTTIGLTNGTAFVGFTGATGGADDNQDILSWTFTPQAQSAPVSTNTAAVLSFNGGTNNNAFDYNAILTGGTGAVTSATVQVKPILISEEACEQLVGKSFPLTQCFVYQNAAGLGVDSAVLFELTCPDQPGGTCGSNINQNFFANLGTDFTFLKSENPGFQLLNSTIGPYAGWLKGSGPDGLHPCTPFLNNSPALFQSNQITSFTVLGDPTGKTVGKSGGGGSCWVATYFTSGEAPPGIKVTIPKFTTYTRNQVVTASYTCSNPKTTKPSTSPVGPYTTVASCTQSQSPNPSNQTQTPGCVPGQVCTGGVDTSVKGLHVFQVNAKDSGGDVNVNVVVYNVK